VPDWQNPRHLPDWTEGRRYCFKGCMVSSTKGRQLIDWPHASSLLSASPARYYRPEEALGGRKVTRGFLYLVWMIYMVHI